MKEWTCDERVSPTESIEQVKARWKKAQEATEEAKYIEKLVFEDYVRTIKRMKTAWDYRISMIKAARDEVNNTKKKERDNISYLESQLITDFLPLSDSRIKITGITQGGYEACYWALYFHFYNGKKLEDDEYIIEIPSRDNVSVSNVDWASGKFRFSKRSSANYITVLFDAWEEEILAEQIRNYFCSGIEEVSSNE